MAEFFTAENLITFLILTALETVLGFDNLLYISIEAKRVAPERQKYVRQVGIVLAIGLRIALLFVVLQLIHAFQDTLFSFSLPPLVSGAISGHSIIVLAGGMFLLYTALKEIYHMLAVPEIGHDVAPRADGRPMRLTSCQMRAALGRALTRSAGGQCVTAFGLSPDCDPAVEIGIARDDGIVVAVVLHDGLVFFEAPLPGCARSLAQRSLYDWLSFGQPCIDLGSRPPKLFEAFSVLL